jgi:hypothetical protein
MQKSSLPSSVLAHPVAIFCGIWTIVFLLYSAGWSGQLVFDIQEFLFVFVVILAFFLFGYGIIALIIRSLPSSSNWAEAVQGRWWRLL